MRSRRRQPPNEVSPPEMAPWWAAACLLIGLCLPQTGVALDLKVQGESHLSAGVRSAGTRLIVNGTLRDDLRKPLPQRPIQIEVREPNEGETVASRTTDTSRQGTFSVSLDVPPGQYEVEARFESTSHVTGASTTASISVVPEPMNLKLQAPHFVHPPAEAVTLSATLLVDGLGVPADGYLEIDGERVRSIHFDDSGLVRLDLADHLQTGRNRVRVVIPDSQHRSGTEATVEVLQVPEPQIESTVSKVFARLQRGVEVAGRLTGESHPVAKTSVEVRLQYRGEQPRPPSSRRSESKSSSRRQPPTRQVETDASGNFRAFFERSKLRDGPWQATVRVRPDAGTPIEQSLGTVRIDRTFTRWMARGAGLLALLALLVVGGREVWWFVQRKLEAYRERQQLRRSREQAFERQDELDPVRLDDLDDGERSARLVRGRVHDVWRDTPVAGADVELRADERDETETTETDDDGRFVWEELPDGDYVLEIRSDRFVDGRYTFSIPHDGTLAGARFDVVPVPLKIRRLYQTLIEMLQGDDLWGRLSPRDIESVVRAELEEFESDRAASEADDTPMVEQLRDLLDDPEGTLESSTDYLEALTDIVEKTYFSGRTYTESTWELARRLALQLREAAEQREEGP